MNRILTRLAARLRRAGFLNEAATIEETMEAKRPPVRQQRSECPIPKFPPGYAVRRTKSGLFSVEGILCGDVVPCEGLKTLVSEIADREKVLGSLKPPPTVLPGKAIIHAPGMDIILSKGRVSVRAFRPLDDPRVWGLADHIDGQRTTTDILRHIGREIKEIQIIRPNHPDERLLLNIAGRLKAGGKVKVDAWSEDIKVMQADLRPYLEDRLPLNLAVKSIHYKNKGVIALETYDRTRNIRAKREPPVRARWLHVLNERLPESDLRIYLNNFKNIRGEISVSEVLDYHFLMLNYYLSVILEGTPTFIYLSDVGSDVDEWTGRRVFDPGKPAGDERTEAFLVPADAEIVEIVTDDPEYRRQAETLGYKVYTEPAGFSTGPDILVPAAIRELAEEWPGDEQPAAVYRIRNLKEKPSRQGFLSPGLVRWVRENGGRFPGAEDEYGGPLWNKDGGLLVTFPKYPKTYQKGPDDKDIAIERLNRMPRLRVLPLPSEFAARQGDSRVRPARLRRLVTMDGEPLEFIDKQHVRTTERGLERLRHHLTHPTELPKRYEERGEGDEQLEKLLLARFIDRPISKQAKENQ